MLERARLGEERNEEPLTTDLLANELHQFFERPHVRSAELKTRHRCYRPDPC